jgi:DNA mismatch repair protein MutL
MPIHLLSDETASQIAAGEVIERPASVVKELMENSIDASSSQIKIAIQGAGQQSIDVADNGSGIPTSELLLAVARHATSKLSSAEDLFNIRTLGFRGEALASIGSVSRMSITTRTRSASMGARLRIEGGKTGVLEAVGSPEGTEILVENLFFNVPARLKFLKRETTERQQVDTLVSRYALAYPSIRFRLDQEGKTVLQTSGNGNRREVLAAIGGIELANQMLEVVFEDENIKVTGYISPTSITRSNRREIAFFINGRWVQDISLNTALLQAYHTLLMVGRYPVAALFIELPPEMVDVNVHPAKAEVRFRQPEQIFSSVQRAVRRALLAYSPVPQVAPPPNWTSGTERMATTLDWEMAADANQTSPQIPLPVASVRASFDASGTSAQPVPSGALPLLRLIGQVGATYLVAEGPDGLYLIDQHAAHERVLFERYMGQLSQTLTSQTLLEPVVVQLSPQVSHLLEDQLPVLQKLGFQVESFGGNSFVVRSIPSLLTGFNPADALRVLVEDFEEDETPLLKEMEARLVARICKRAAVKAGKVLSNDEQRALLQDLEACQSPRTCPHGRPVMIHLSVDLLERQFGRRGAR